jgi:hypothetical protein
MWLMNRRPEQWRDRNDHNIAIDREWLNPGITPCVKTQKIRNRREQFFQEGTKSDSLANFWAFTVTRKHSSTST